MGDNAFPGDDDRVDVTFVVIGFNEGPTLRASLDSCRDADLRDVTHELIYVDGGSTDDSVAIARSAATDRILGGDKRRRAAENRNLGLMHARGEYVQFVDGDMTIAPDWPLAAVAFLHNHAECAAVCGHIHEANPSRLFRALQMDWAPREGYIRHCGGAAMYRKSALERMGGFPEDVAYGEEPYLCWRLRNELGLRIYQLHRLMAHHDLGFSGVRDYWRRNVRCGMTYAEIAARCRRGKERLWMRESLRNLAWLGAWIALACMIAGGGTLLRAFVVGAAAGVLLRKFLHTRRKGCSNAVAAIYACHTYFCKIPIAWGELKWLAARLPRLARGGTL